MSNFSSPIQVTPQNVYTVSTTQGISVGVYAETSDGRGFRYVYNNGTALVPGKVYTAPAESTSNYEKLGVSVAAGTGTFLVTTGSTVTLTANQLAGGLLTVASSTGAGYSYKIASHPAVTSGTVTFTLEDPLVIALATTSTINTAPNPYNGVIVAPTTLTGVPIGVAVSPIGGSQWGWIQTRGLVGTLVDATAPAVGQAVAVSLVTGGAVGTNSGTQVTIGYAAQTTTSAQYANIFLELD